jgi:hypothetical protein
LIAFILVSLAITLSAGFMLALNDHEDDERICYKLSDYRKFMNGDNKEVDLCDERL